MSHESDDRRKMMHSLVSIESSLERLRDSLIVAMSKDFKDNVLAIENADEVIDIVSDIKDVLIEYSK